LIGAAASATPQASRQFDEMVQSALGYLIVPVSVETLNFGMFALTK
jgi:hypothetical protein